MTDPAVQAFVREALADEMLRDLEAAGVLGPGPGYTVEQLTRQHLESRAAGITGLRQIGELLDSVVDQALQHVEDLRAHVDLLRHTLRRSGELALRAVLLSEGGRRFFGQPVAGDVVPRVPDKAEESS